MNKEAVTAGGNVTKFKAFQLAFSAFGSIQDVNLNSKLTDAHKIAFFIGVTALAESMISDRIMSYLNGTGRIITNERGNVVVIGNATFYQLIQALDVNVDHSYKRGTHSFRFTNLRNKIDEWRKKRNDIIHKFVKSEPGTPVELFSVDDIYQIAVDGYNLADAIKRWVQKQMP